MRGVVCAGPALAASFALWERAAVTQAPQQGDRPVEQTRKNIGPGVPVEDALFVMPGPSGRSARGSGRRAAAA